MTKEGCIINPVTGRAVKTTTKLGKKLAALADRLDEEYKGEKVLKAAAKRALAQQQLGDKNKAKKNEVTFKVGEYNIKGMPADLIIIVEKITQNFVTINKLDGMYKSRYKIFKTEVGEEYMFVPAGHPYHKGKKEATKLYAKDLIELK